MARSRFSRLWAKDTAERVASSAAEAFLASIVVGGLVDSSWTAKLALAGTAAGLAAAKSALAALRADTLSPASVVHGPGPLTSEVVELPTEPAASPSSCATGAVVPTPG